MEKGSSKYKFQLEKNQYVKYEYEDGDGKLDSDTTMIDKDIIGMRLDVHFLST